MIVYWQLFYAYTKIGIFGFGGGYAMPVSYTHLPGTKIVCLGNIAQIDTPYLTEGSSGLTYVVDRFRGWEHGGHVMLARGERSRLADYATDVL